MLPLILKNSDYPWSPWSLLEFLAASGRKEGKEHSFIRNKDIVLSKDGLKITLWKTKTDNKNIGVNKFIANLSGCLINPCNLVKGLKIARRLALKPEDPFFVTPNGKPISRDSLVKFLERDFPKEGWSHICHEQELMVKPYKKSGTGHPQPTSLI